MLLIASLGGFLAFEFTDYVAAQNWMYIGLWISELAGFLMLLINGTFLKTKYFKYFIGVCAIVLIATLFKILHWSFSSELLIIGFIGLALVYFLSFLKKPIKNRLDYLKLGWVVIAYTIALLKILHIIGDQYQIIASAIMWLAILDYMKTERKRRRLFK